MPVSQKHPDGSAQTSTPILEYPDGEAILQDVLADLIEWNWIMFDSMVSYVHSVSNELVHEWLMVI